MRDARIESSHPSRIASHSHRRVGTIMKLHSLCSAAARGSLLLALAYTIIVHPGVPSLAQPTPSPDAITADSARQVQFASEIETDGIVNDLAFSPDGALLLTAGEDTAVRVWSLEDNTQVAESFEHFSFVKGAAFTENVIATASWDRSLIFWNLTEDGDLSAQTTVGGFDAVIEHIAVSPDGSRIAFGVGDGRVRVADAATGAVQYELAVGSLRVTALAYSPDGANLAAAGGFPATGAAVWDAVTGAQFATIAHPGMVTALAYAPDGSFLAAAGSDGTITFWRAGEQLAVVRVEDWVTDIAFSPDGTLLAAARQDGTMTLWDVRDPASPELSVAMVAADSSINALAFSPDGARMATAAEDGSVRLWHVGD